MLKSLTASLAFSILFLGCDHTKEVAPVPAETEAAVKTAFTSYVIPQNHHFTSHNFGVVKSNQLKFIAKFDESAVYTTADQMNQADINKLYGFSDCGTDHLSNSARFGWRWYHNQLEILAYTYKNGKRTEQFIAAIALNQEYEYELTAFDNKYVFKLGDKTVEMERGCSGNADKYKLFPYFGGDETAPHDIKIEIKEIP